MNRPRELLLVLLTVLWLRRAEPCWLHGSNIGECSTLPLDANWRKTIMPFCADAIIYPACLPKTVTLPPSREFPNGRWYNNTVTNKDAWVQQSVVSHLAQRIGYERNAKTARNEFGDVGWTRKRFTLPNGAPRLDCQLAFKNYFCWINFPRCNVEQEETLPTCRSACINFFRTCHYHKSLWRCGKSKWFNGNEPDPGYDGYKGDHLSTYPNTTYLREYFPGQPFRQNKYTTMGVERPICTPAIINAASAKTAPSLAMTLLLAVVCTVFAASSSSSSSSSAAAEATAPCGDREEGDR